MIDFLTSSLSNYLELVRYYYFCTGYKKNTKQLSEKSDPLVKKKIKNKTKH
jgi:hypothetical protein